jgi:Flp pilus assembly pilin Flp
MFDRFNSFLGSVLAGNVNLKSEDGQTFVEYALVLSVIVVALFLAFTYAGLSDAITGAVEAITDAFDTTPAAPPADQ